MIKIALIGYGKMGKAVEKMAKDKSHEIVACVDSFPSKLEQIQHADVAIDFTHPQCVLENIKLVASLKKNMVIGTTGWYEKIQEVQKLVEEHQIGLIYSPNFSLGINLFLEIVEYAASLMDRFDEYDVAGFEAHHNAKVDSPSGTAESIAKILLKHFHRKKTAIFETPQRKIASDEIHFPSLRLGSIPGEHTVIFDSEADTIRLKHEARSRKGFALGAVLAAEWICGKKGFYEMKDLMRDLHAKEIVKDGP